MKQLRPVFERFFYVPNKYSSYLDQLGIAYPGTAPTK